MHQNSVPAVPDQSVDLLCLDVIKPPDSIFDLLLVGSYIHNEHLSMQANLGSCFDSVSSSQVAHFLPVQCVTHGLCVHRPMQ